LGLATLAFGAAFSTFAFVALGDCEECEKLSHDSAWLALLYLQPSGDSWSSEIESDGFFLNTSGVPDPEAEVSV
jgi:hypothetical protein